MVKTRGEISQDILNRIALVAPTADMSSGTVLKDVVSDVPAVLLESVYAELELIRKSYSISYVDQLTEAQVDALAANWNLTRRGATFATGSIIFARHTSPASDIEIGSVDGRGGIIVSTATLSDGSVLSFITTQTVHLRTTTPRNPVSGLFEVSAPIRALVAGAFSNVGAGVITSFSGITGIDRVFNRVATTGGTIQESNSDLARRIVVAAQGRLLGTVPGYKSFVLNQLNLRDCAVIPPGDREAVRVGIDEGTDVILLGQNVVSVTQSQVFNLETELRLTFLPCEVFSRIEGTRGGLPHLFVLGTDYVFVRDDFSVNRDSVRALDRIVWVGGVRPDVGTSYVLHYSYDKMVGDIQAILDDERNSLIRANILVKRGVRVLVDISLVAGIYPGLSREVAIFEIKSVLSSYINNLGLGDILQQSDLVAVLRSRLPLVVDNVVIPFTRLSRRGTVGVSDLPALKTEYFRVDDVSLTVRIV